MATIDEFALKNIGLWWRYGISRHCDESKYIIIGQIFESEIILIITAEVLRERSGLTRGLPVDMAYQDNSNNTAPSIGTITGC
jgi:hypothetical protein